MKATDQEIIHAVWRETLKRISERGVQHYVNRQYRVKVHTVHDLKFSTTLYRAGRRSLRINLSDCQLLKRMKCLSILAWGDGESSYFIDTPHREAAFCRALDLYREHGLTDTPQPFTDEKIKSIMKSVETTLLDEWLGVFPKGG